MKRETPAWFARWRARAEEIAVFRILLRAGQRYGETEASQGAAGLAYYILFSLFPLMLLLVSVASYALNLGNQHAFQQATDFITTAVPVSQEIISSNLETVLQQRGAVGLVGLVSTLWSASGAFTVLSQHINRAWSGTERRGFVRKRLVAFAMVGAILLLLLLSVGATTLLQLLPGLSLPDGPLRWLERATGAVILRGVPLLFTALMFFALYRWIPKKSVRWRAVLWGGAITAIAWEIAKLLFAWFLESGLANYRQIYGSLGSVVALLFWIYISASIVLFGAHLTAAIDVEEDPL